MFNWLTNGGEDGFGMDHMRSSLGLMLDEGRHVFVSAANALLGGTDVDVIRQDLFSTDRRINQAERRIRREIVVHTTVHGVNSVPECLVLMSIVKDAERVGDYAKNIFDLAELTPVPSNGKYKPDLIVLKDRISNLMVSCREVFDMQDIDAAKQLILEAEAIEDHCDDKISTIITEDKGREMSASYALSYRYFKRVTSHSLNVLTSIVQPLDKLDYSYSLDVQEEDGGQSQAG